MRYFYPLPQAREEITEYITWDPEAQLYSEYRRGRQSIINIEMSSKTMNDWIDLVVHRNKTWIEGLDVGL